MYVLDVFYDRDEKESLQDQFVSMDADADEAAGRINVASGYDHGKRSRDLEYRFGSETELESAKVRLRDAGFRLVERLN